MKSALSLVIFLALLTTLAGADASVGLRGGLNLANTNYGDNLQQQSRMGFNGGVFGQLSLPASLLLEGNFIYTQKGFRDPGLFSTMEYFTLDYVELPLLLKYDLRLGKNSELRLQPGLGVSGAYPLNGIYLWTDNEDNIIPDINSDILDKMNDLTLGWEAVLDLIVNNKILVGVRYNNSLTETFEGSNYRDGYKNFNFMLNLGVLLD